MQTISVIPVVGVVVELRSPVLAEPVRANATQPRTLINRVLVVGHGRGHGGQRPQRRQVLVKGIGHWRLRRRPFVSENLNRKLNLGLSLKINFSFFQLPFIIKFNHYVKLEILSILLML